jgi:hypothetical protein
MPPLSPGATPPVSEMNRGQARELFANEAYKRHQDRLQVIAFGVANAMTTRWDAAGLRFPNLKNVNGSRSSEEVKINSRN